MMSECIVPNWNLRHQRQEEQVEGEERNRSPHVQFHQNLSYVVPMSKYEVTELTWENGQLALHGLGGILPPPPPPQTSKQTWDHKPGVGDTLESIVHQATHQLPPNGRDHHGKYPTSTLAVNSTSHMHTEHNQDGKWSENSTHMHLQHENPDQGGGKWRESLSHMQVEGNGEMKPSPTTLSGGKWRENSNSAQQMEVKANPAAASSGGKWREMDDEQGKGVVKLSSKWGETHSKRVRSAAEQGCGRKSFQAEESGCASASAAFCRDTDTTNLSEKINLDTFKITNSIFRTELNID
ncbi:uncharacterized protein LOC105169392 [Sesamum indicum]|uniref:Uncharacterized protein LOC105169392 n=1 Tax=Sesamum indicum TaxID=4182 RepID=A0A6I9TT76_SESIN|nr:uncharacterized protein LOC105169392 [Sesamum indicum]